MKSNKVRKWATEQERADAVALYESGVFITEIAAKFGRGTTTIFRWVEEAGSKRPFSERVAGRDSQSRECIGKKSAFQSIKCGTWIHADSTYEFARLWQHEEDRDVASFSRCDDRISYEFGGSIRTYRPDFRVLMADGRVVIEEVKPQRYLSDQKVMAKAQAATQYYSERGTEYRLVTEVQIGSSVIAAATDHLKSHQDPEYAIAQHDRRKAQRRASQKKYYRNLRETMTPAQESEFRAKMAAYRRNVRARKSG